MKKHQQKVFTLKMEGFDSEVKAGMSRRLEEAISRLSLALEELEETRREEEKFNSLGAKWKQVAKVIDRSVSTKQSPRGCSVFTFETFCSGTTSNL